MKKHLFILGLVMLLSAGTPALGDDNIKVADLNAQANNQSDASNKVASATEKGVAVIGDGNIVANDDGRIEHLDYSVASTNLEQVNTFGLDGAKDFRFDNLKGDDIHFDFHSTVGVTGANVASGNFNNQANLNSVATSVSRPDFFRSPSP